MPSTRKCIYPGCKVGKSEEITVRLHNFPLAQERCKLWLQRIGVSAYDHLSPDDLSHRGLCICERHFTDESYYQKYSRHSSKLLPNAVPKESSSAKHLIPVNLGPRESPVQNQRDVANEGKVDDSNQDNMSTSQEFSCTKCNQVFHTNVVLQHHMLHSHEHKQHESHTSIATSQGMNGELQLECRGCREIFHNIYQLTRHVTASRQVRSSPCGVVLRCVPCDVTVRGLSRIKRHARQHEAITPLKCPVCCKSGFGDFAILEKHMARRHGPQQRYRYVCYYCDTCFTMRDALSRHVERYHKWEMEALQEGLDLELKCTASECTFVTNSITLLRHHERQNHMPAQDLEEEDDWDYLSSEAEDEDNMIVEREDSVVKSKPVEKLPGVVRKTVTVSISDEQTERAQKISATIQSNTVEAVRAPQEPPSTSTPTPNPTAEKEQSIDSDMTSEELPKFSPLALNYLNGISEEGHDALILELEHFLRKKRPEDIRSTGQKLKFTVTIEKALVATFPECPLWPKPTVQPGTEDDLPLSHQVYRRGRDFFVRLWGKLRNERYRNALRLKANGWSPPRDHNTASTSDERQAKTSSSHARLWMSHSTPAQLSTNDEVQAKTTPTSDQAKAPSSHWTQSKASKSDQTRVSMNQSALAKMPMSDQARVSTSQSAQAKTPISDQARVSTSHSAQAKTSTSDQVQAKTPTSDQAKASASHSAQAKTPTSDQARVSTSHSAQAKPSTSDQTQAKTPTSDQARVSTSHWAQAKASVSDPAQAKTSTGNQARPSASHWAQIKPSTSHWALARTPTSDQTKALSHWAQAKPTNHWALIKPSTSDQAKTPTSHWAQGKASTSHWGLAKASTSHWAKASTNNYALTRVPNSDLSKTLIRQWAQENASKIDRAQAKASKIDRAQPKASTSDRGPASIEPSSSSVSSVPQVSPRPTNPQGSDTHAPTLPRESSAKDTGPTSRSSLDHSQEDMVIDDDTTEVVQLPSRTSRGRAVRPPVRFFQEVL